MRMKPRLAKPYGRRNKAVKLRAGTTNPQELGYGR